MRITVLAALLAAMICADAGAQMTRSRERMGSPRESFRDRDAARQAAAAADPITALERELPSLKVDLRLTAAQVEAWSAFERDVRDVAEMDRVRAKRALALRGAEESHKTAMAVVSSIAEDDRLKAEASADLRRHLEKLYALLDEAQRRMLDRRVVMSQTEPIGSAPAPR